QAAHIGAVRSGLAPEAGRVRGVAEGQGAPVEDLTAIEIRERHFRRGHQVKIPLSGNLEEVLLELRQVAGADQRRAVCEERRLDFRVAVGARVEIENEVYK